MEEFVQIIDKRKADTRVVPSGDGRWDEYTLDELQSLQHAVYIKEKLLDYTKQQPASLQSAEIISDFLRQARLLLGDGTLTIG